MSIPPALSLLGAYRSEARVLAEVEVDVPSQRTVLVQRCPATAAGGVAVVVAFPGELDARAPVTLAVVAIHPPLHGDEPELAAPVGAELDEAGSQEVNGLRIPEVHLHDPPGTGHAHRGSSESRITTAATGAASRLARSLRTSRARGLVFISPWVLGYTGVKDESWNAWIFGVITVILALWELQLRREVARRPQRAAGRLDVR
jgi:hypothetical protein